MPLVERIEPGPDTIRVLLTTDNHVGAFENDQLEVMMHGKHLMKSPPLPKIKMLI